ncbi:MAG: LysR family transcriptional regulator [Rubrivivax sp.]|nr:LysR family transcriptional regulator [Rubrivivax sp.]
MDRLLSMRVFRRVIDEGSFAAAARALDLSPAVVTRLVADLEAHLGTRLLQRTTRRLAVTDAGAAYVERLRSILADIDEADASVGAQTRELAGLLHISAPPLLATYLVGPLIAGFRRLHPNIRFELDADAWDSPAIENHDITLLATDEGYDGSIVARHILTVEAVLVASPAYLARSGVPQRPEDLSRHECLRMRLPGLRPNVWRLRRSGAAGDEVVDVPVRPVLWTNHSEALMRATLDGAGIGSTSLEIAAVHLAKGELVRLLAPWNVGRPSVYAALPSRKFTPQRVRAFLDYTTAQTQAMLAAMEAGVPRFGGGR